MGAPPAATIIAAVSSIVSGRWYDDGCPRVLRPVQYTKAPASPSARAMPRPAPRVAPATSATRPASGFTDDLVFFMPSLNHFDSRSATWRLGKRRVAGDARRTDRPGQRYVHRVVRRNVVA